MNVRRFALTDFKKAYEGYRQDDPNVPISKYVDIMRDIFVEIHIMIIRETQSFKMPYNLGQIQIDAISNKAAVDLGHYNKTGQSKKLSNLHSNREIYRFMWHSKTNHSVANHKFYKYTAPVDYKTKLTGRRGLAKWIKDCANDPKKPDFVAYNK